MDYIGVKTYDADGIFNGERRFVGLFTSNAYSTQPRAIPLLRRKIDQVMTRAGLAPASHNGKALIAYPGHLSPRRAVPGFRG
jgi:glutamate dehydrogenase